MCSQHQRLQEQPFPGFLIEAAVQDGYGPWPDFWGREGDFSQQLVVSGLQQCEHIDATANTLPSHRFTTPKHIDWVTDCGNPAIRAALALRWMHENGWMKYQYFCLKK